MPPRDEPPDEPVVTPRLCRGFGLLACGLGVMFLFGKALAGPVSAGIAVGIVLAVSGFVLLIVEALRDAPDGPRERPRD
jgi:hypothetical protein